MNSRETNNRRARHCLPPVLAALVLAGWAGMFSPQSAPAQDDETRIISLSGDLNFGDVLIGSSTQRMLTISNEGNSTLTVSNIYGPPQPVSLLGGFSGTWSGTIAPGASQDVAITFAPEGSTVFPINTLHTNDVGYGGDIWVDSDATGGNASIPVSGVGTFGPPVRSISLNESNLNFGKVELGGPTSLPLIITNNGNSVLTISNISLPDGFLFSFFPPDTRSVSATLDPGASANFFVYFAPTNVANYGGTVTINSDATGGTVEFTVSGEGDYPTGHYIGLFYPPFNTTLDNSGRFSANATGGGAVSGVLQLAGKRYPFAGHFSSSAAFSTELTNGLYVSFLGFANACLGTVSNDTWTANLSAYHTVLFRDGLRRPIEAFKPGKYQIAIAGSTNLLLAPTNDGSGTIRIAASQDVLLSGTLGDGTTFSQGTMLCGGSQVPFYASLYGGQGVALGWIHCVVIPTNLMETGIPITIMPGTNILQPFTNISITNFPPFTNAVPVTNILHLSNSPPRLAEPAPAREFLSRTNQPGNVPVQIPGTNYIWGSINWFKPPQIDSNYPNGFSFQTTVSGPLP